MFDFLGFVMPLGFEHSAPANAKIDEHVVTMFDSKIERLTYCWQIGARNEVACDSVLTVDPHSYRVWLTRRHSPAD